MKNVINVKNVSKIFNIKDKPNNKVLDNISFKVNEGEFISIVGPSGSGKTTLLKTISGLSLPDEGEVSILNNDPYKMSPNKAAKFRLRNIGFIFQSYNLIPSLPAFDNITLPLKLSHKKINYSKIYDLLRKINFHTDPSKFVTELSGGEQQKIAIARTLVTDAKVVFADEPTGALDTKSKNSISNLLCKLSSHGISVIMVTHDISMASKTDRSIVLKDGKLGNVINKPTSEKIFREIEGEE